MDTEMLQKCALSPCYLMPVCWSKKDLLNFSFLWNCFTLNKENYYQILCKSKWFVKPKGNEQSEPWYTYTYGTVPPDVVSPNFGANCFCPVAFPHISALLSLLSPLPCTLLFLYNKYINKNLQILYAACTWSKLCW